MDERDERGLEASADEKIGLGLSPDGGLTEFVGCEAMDMPRTGFSERDMLARRARRPGEFENYRSPWSRPGQNKTTNRDVSVFVVMVRAFLRASLARHNENERWNDPGWWENHSQPRSHRRIPFETNSEGRVQRGIKTPPWSPLLTIPFNQFSSEKPKLISYYLTPSVSRRSTDLPTFDSVSQLTSNIARLVYPDMKLSHGN
jgi:hypothetical protein